MNAEYRRLLQEFVDSPYQVLVSTGRNMYNKIWPELESMSRSGDCSDLIVAIFATTCAVDGKFTELEYNFMLDVLKINFSYSDLKSLVEEYTSPKWIETIDTIIDRCDNDTKINIATLCICLTAVDKTITRDECAFIDKLLA